MTKAHPALILIVDDDYDFLQAMRMVLEQAGYRVNTAVEPEKALEAMDDETPDLVITDLMMTSLDSGFLLARAIKEHPRFASIPVVMATSVSSALGLDFQPRTDEEQADMYVDDYLNKPLDPPRLLAVVARLLQDAAPSES